LRPKLAAGLCGLRILGAKDWKAVSGGEAGEEYKYGGFMEGLEETQFRMFGEEYPESNARTRQEVSNEGRKMGSARFQARFTRVLRPLCES
jgi:hypothetical protein